MALMSHRELAERPIAHCLLKCVHLLKFCMSATLAQTFLRENSATWLLTLRDNNTTKYYERHESSLTDCKQQVRHDSTKYQAAYGKNAMARIGSSLQTDEG